MRLLVGGLLLVLALPPLPAGAGQRHRHRSRPAAGRLGRGARPARRPDVVAELLAFYNDSATTRMQGDVSFPAGQRRSPAGWRCIRGSLRLAGQRAGRRGRDQRHAVPAARSGRRGRRAGRGRPPDPKSRRPATWGASGWCGTRRPVLRSDQAARWCCASDAVRSASSPRRAPASRPAGCAPRCCSPPAAPTTGSRGCRSSSGRRSSCGPRGGRWRGWICAALLRTAGEGSRLSSDFGYGARAELRFPGGGVAGPGLQRGGAVRGSAAVGGGERLVGLPAAARLPRLVRAARRRRRGLGTADPLAPLRAVAPARPRALGPGHRSLVAAPQQRPLAPQSAERRRPLLHDRRCRSISTPATTASTPSTGWMLRARYEHSTSDDVAPLALPETVRPPIPTGGGYAFDRLTLDLRRYSRLTPGTAGQRPAPGRRLDRRRPDADPAAGLARRPRPAAGLRVPRVHLRAARLPATPPSPPCATAPSPRRSRSALAWASTSATACASARGGPGRFIGHRGGGPGLPRRRRQGVARGQRAGPGPGEPDSLVPGVEGGRGRRAGRGADRRVPGQEPERGRAGALPRETAAPILVPLLASPRRRRPLRCALAVATALGLGRPPHGRRPPRRQAVRLTVRLADDLGRRARGRRWSARRTCWTTAAG